jgi:hypothetical protein
MKKGTNAGAQVADQEACDVVRLPDAALLLGETVQAAYSSGPECRRAGR